MKGPQTAALQLSHRMRAFVLDSKEFILGVTDQNVVAGHLEGHVAAIRYLSDIGQFSKIAVVQTDFSCRWFGVGIVASANINQHGFLFRPMLLFFFQRGFAVRIMAPLSSRRQRGKTIG